MKDISWRHLDMEMLSKQLALCEGNPTVTSWFSLQRASNAQPWCLCNILSGLTKSTLCDMMLLSWHDNDFCIWGIPHKGPAMVYASNSCEWKVELLVIGDDLKVMWQSCDTTLDEWPPLMSILNIRCVNKCNILWYIMLGKSGQMKWMSNMNANLERKRFY